jgi:Na+-driven multidrug efflux pump
MQNVKAIVSCSGVKSPSCRAYLPGKYLRSADGGFEHLPGELAGKEAMAGVGLADSFNMVVISFFAAIDLGTTVVVAFSLGKLDPKRAREAARQSLMIMTIFSIVLAAVIHYFGKEIIDFVAGEPRTRLKTWR